MFQCLITIVVRLKETLSLSSFRETPLGAWHSSRFVGQLAELGQHGLPQELGQDCSRYLLDSPQTVQRHATRWNSYTVYTRDLDKLNLIW